MRKNRHALLTAAIAAGQFSCLADRPASVGTGAVTPAIAAEPVRLLTADAVCPLAAVAAFPGIGTAPETVAKPPAASIEQSVSCLYDDEARVTLPDGTRWSFYGYESEAEGACVAFLLPETKPPPEPGAQAYIISRKEVREARAAKQDVLTHLFGDQAPTVMRFNRLDPRFAYAGRKIWVPQLPDGRTEYAPLPEVYVPALKYPKYIVVDIKRQFMGLYECGSLIASFPISSGTKTRGPKGESYQTPTGLFRVLAKDADHESSKYPEPDGGAPMPHAVKFISSGYWFHGGDLVGYAASHGCIRLLYEDAPKVFAWADIGTPVRVSKSLD